MKTLIDLCDAAEAELKRQGLSARQALYMALGIDEPIHDSKPIYVYRGIPIMTFESDAGTLWFAMAPGHSTLVAIGKDASTATLAVRAKIDELLLTRPLSRLEHQQCMAVSRGVNALYQLSGKDAVNAFGMALTTAYPDKKLSTACYLLANKLAYASDDLPEKTKEWAYLNMLKYSPVTGLIEEQIMAQLKAMA